MPHRRIPRSDAEMVRQLERALNLLEDYCERAFSVNPNDDYLPEIATKLRMLLVRRTKGRRPSNVPLLFEVADRFGLRPQVTLDGPPVERPDGEPGPGDTIDLDRFFDLRACLVRTSDGLVWMTKRELIAAWAQQLGGAHDDWEVEERLVSALFIVPKEIPIFGGLQPSKIELQNCARTALREGRNIVGEAKRRLAETDP